MNIFLVFPKYLMIQTNKSITGTSQNIPSVVPKAAFELAPLSVIAVASAISKLLEEAIIIEVAAD